MLEIRQATALTTGAKYWHRQKAVFLCFCFSAASIFCVVGFVRWGYFWGDNNFWGWCYVIGLEFVCACARIVIFS